MPMHRCFLPFGYCDAYFGLGGGEGRGKRAVEVGLGRHLVVASSLNGSVILWSLISAQ